MSQAAAAAGEYLRLLDRIDALGLDAEVSVKLTQLGFDLEPEATMMHMERLADRSADMGRTVWIDMESSAYVDGTIDLYASLLATLTEQWAVPAGVPAPDVGRRAEARAHEPDHPAGEGCVPRAEGRRVPGQAPDRRELLPAREPSR